MLAAVETVKTEIGAKTELRTLPFNILPKSDDNDASPSLNTPSARAVARGARSRTPYTLSLELPWRPIV